MKYRIFTCLAIVTLLIRCSGKNEIVTNIAGIEINMNLPSSYTKSNDPAMKGIVYTDGNTSISLNVQDFFKPLIDNDPNFIEPHESDVIDEIYPTDLDCSDYFNNIGLSDIVEEETCRKVHIGGRYKSVRISYFYQAIKRNEDTYAISYTTYLNRRMIYIVMITPTLNHRLETRKKVDELCEEIINSIRIKPTMKR